MCDDGESDEADDILDPLMTAARSITTVDAVEKMNMLEDDEDSGGGSGGPVELSVKRGWKNIGDFGFFYFLFFCFFNFFNPI